MSRKQALRGSILSRHAPVRGGHRRERAGSAARRRQPPVAGEPAGMRRAPGIGAARGGRGDRRRFRRPARRRRCVARGVRALARTRRLARAALRDGAAGLRDAYDARAARPLARGAVHGRASGGRDPRGLLEPAVLAEAERAAGIERGALAVDWSIEARDDGCAQVSIAATARQHVESRVETAAAADISLRAIDGEPAAGVARDTPCRQPSNSTPGSATSRAGWRARACTRGWSATMAWRTRCAIRRRNIASITDACSI